MRVMILADLHFDFWKEDKKLDRLGSYFDDIDALILAGDVSNKARVRWKQAFAWLSNFVSPSQTYVFPGNHDYYDHRLDGDYRLEETAQAAGVTFAQRKSIILDNTRFLCATLWTDMALGSSLILNKYTVEITMNDFRYIRMERKGYGRINAEDIATAHRTDLTWLDKELSKPFNGKTVVVTHHAPHPSGLNPKKKGSAVDAAYASDLSSFLKAHNKNASHWFYGHSHGGENTTFMDWKLRSISLGYPMENPDLKILKNFVLDTKSPELLA